MVRLAMAWAVQRPAVDGVLIGARDASHIDNAVEALSVPLADEVLAEMDSWN
jgi:aryl-alcohol dehydrogenase-like predicted oxidoreductase